MCAALVMPSALDAQVATRDSIADDSPARRLNTVRVSVTRDAARSPFELPFALTTAPISARPAQRRTSVSDLLLAVPGVQVQDRSKPSQDARIAVRGFGARSAFGVRGVRVLRDGVPLSLPDGQTPIDWLDLETVDRVDVVRGTAAALYGNAAGGVVDVRSRAPSLSPLAMQARWWNGGGLQRARRARERLCENHFATLERAMLPDQPHATDAATAGQEPAAASRKRPRPGERRVQIMQALAQMLEQPGGERVTTAALAARLQVSEAALYRHFASKAQMFEGLIDFIESSVFGLVNQINEGEQDGRARAARIVAMVLQFGERNPGMARVMVGDALVHEHERLQQRMNQLFDKLEAALRQGLREGAAQDGGALTPDADAQVTAAVLTAFVAGRLQRFARSGFRRLPSDKLEACIARML